MRGFEGALGKFLDTFFHLPTLITIAIISVAFVCWIYGLGLDFGNGFLRLNSNQGSINLFWTDGCCELDW